MKTFTIVLASFVALVSLIQPCPAPPLAAIGAAIAGAATSAGAVAAGTAALGGAVAGGVTAGLDHIHKKKRSRFDGHSSSDKFTACIADTPGAASKTRMIIGTDAIVVNGTAQSWAVINGVPASCMTQINLYNAHPNIADLNAMHGTTTIVNDTAILLTGMPDHFMAYLHTFIKA